MPLSFSYNGTGFHVLHIPKNANMGDDFNSRHQLKTKSEAIICRIHASKLSFAGSSEYQLTKLKCYGFLSIFCA